VEFAPQGRKTRNAAIHFLEMNARNAGDGLARAVWMLGELEQVAHGHLRESEFPALANERQACQMIGTVNALIARRTARVRSLSWSAEGDFLATSGSEQLILWPFDGKNGPMGRQPTILARAGTRVAVVACHPRQPVAAVGYADGKVLLVRIDDGALILVREADGVEASALGWADDGQQLAFGTEGGSAGVLAF